MSDFDRAARLSIWVVYDHPRDFPDRIVVRQQFAQADGSVAADPKAYLFFSLDSARQWLRLHGLTCLARHPHDDPVIVETWL